MSIQHYDFPIPKGVNLRYIHGIDLPDYVAEHPIIEALGQAANDLVSWANVGRLFLS